MKMKSATWLNACQLAGCERVIDQIESMPAIVRVIDQIESMPAIVTLSVLSGLQRVRPVVRFGKRGSL